jgi:hypothetical protein
MADPGRLALELLDEQVRHQLAVVWVIGQAREWDGILQVQEDFVRSSFERMQRLTACCLDVLQLRIASTIPWLSTAQITSLQALPPKQPAQA